MKFWANPKLGLFGVFGGVKNPKTKQIKSIMQKWNAQNRLRCKINLLFVWDDPDKIPNHAEVVRTIYPKKLTGKYQRTSKMPTNHLVFCPHTDLAKVHILIRPQQSNFLISWLKALLQKWLLSFIIPSQFHHIFHTALNPEYRNTLLMLSHVHIFLLWTIWMRM